MDFPAVRHLATEIGYSDIMEITRRDVYPPALTEIEETAAYTFSKLVHPSRLLRVTVGELLSEISDQIWTTWHIRIDPAEMEMSWTNLEGWSC